MIRQRLFTPILGLLQKGATPEKIALSVAVGLTLGTVPILGFTTLLCAAAAMLLRLNLAVTQLVNWLVYPIQLVLVVPFFKLGAWIFGDADSGVALRDIFHLIRSDGGHAIAALGAAALHGLAAWAVCGFAEACLVYLALVPCMRRLLAREAEKAPPVVADELDPEGGSI